MCKHKCNEQLLTPLCTFLFIEIFLSFVVVAVATHPSRLRDPGTPQKLRPYDPEKRFVTH